MSAAAVINHAYNWSNEVKTTCLSQKKKCCFLSSDGGVRVEARALHTSKYRIKHVPCGNIARCRRGDGGASCRCLGCASMSTRPDPGRIRCVGDSHPGSLLSGECGTCAKSPANKNPGYNACPLASVELRSTLPVWASALKFHGTVFRWVLAPPQLIEV